METTQGPGEPDREGFVSEESQEGESPDVHTGADEEHPGGEGERSDRELGGPTSPDDEPDEDVSGGGPSKSPDGGFDSHE